MPQGLRPLSHTDFSGGIDAVASPYHTAKNTVQRLENFILDETGELNLRDGSRTLFQGPVTIQEILRIADMNRNNGQTVPLLIARMIDGTNHLFLYATPPAPWVDLATFNTAYDLPEIVPWLGQAFIAAGYETPWMTDGVTATPIVGTPLATPGAPTVTPAGTTGGTTYTYVLVAVNAQGNTPAGPPGSTAIGNATLSTSNYNVITWTAVPNVVGYHLYRTVGGTTTGRIAVLGASTTNFLDIGLQGNNVTPPTVDTTTSVIPGANHLILHQNVLWAWNTAATNSTYDGPSSLRQSALGRADLWPVAFQVFVDKDNGQVGTGLAVFTVAETGIAPDDFLVLFKQFTTYIVNGTFGFDVAGNLITPAITRVKTNMGNLAPRSTQFISAPNTYGLLRLTHLGFALFDGLNDTILSERIRPYIFGHNDVVGIDGSQVIHSTAALSQNPLMYLCACPLQGKPGLTRVFAYDVLRQAWTICTFPVPFATLVQRELPGFPPTTLAGSGVDGRIWQLFQQDQTDDGVLITGTVRIPPLGQPSQRGYVQRCLLTMFHLAAGQAVTARFALGPAARVVSKSTTIKAGGVAAFAPPGSPVTALPDADIPFTVQMKGEALYSEFTVTGTSPTGIRALTWHVRSKPLTRPMSV